MKNLTRVFILGSLAAALALPAFPQAALCTGATVPLCSQPVGVNLVQIKPQAVPTSTTIVGAVDAYLVSVTISNSTSGALTFTLADRQGSPVAAIPAVSVAANSIFIAAWAPGAYWCPGGFTVLASSTGLTMQGSFRQ